MNAIANTVRDIFANRNLVLVLKKEHKQMNHSTVTKAFDAFPTGN